MMGNLCQASVPSSHGKVKQDTLQAEKNLLLTRSHSVPLEIPVGEEEDLRVLSSDVKVENLSVSDKLGPGLRNDPGEYNFFLNVIVQSFWHLRKLRDKFFSRSTSTHMHIGNHCLVCALQEVFNALSVASAQMQREAVSPMSLRIALRELNPDSIFFQEVQMNNASEVLAINLDCLHQSFTSHSGVSDTESSGSKCVTFWDCNNDACIAHELFGMDILQKMICYNCGIESSLTKYTTFFYGLHASTLRTMKNIEPDLDKLFKLVEMYFQLSHLACDPGVANPTASAVLSQLLHMCSQ